MLYIWAYKLRDTPFKVNAVDPDFSDTDFNSHCGIGTVEEAAARVVKYAVIDADGPTGKFLARKIMRKPEKYIGINFEG